MNDSGSKERGFGDLLRFWRQQRGKSQLELSLDASVSQRHLSFLETGRSTPGRDLLLRLSRVLAIPLRERNVLLLSAGFAPLYTGEAMDAPEMAVVQRAVDRVLAQQEPYPALVLDRHWSVIKTNGAARRIFGAFVDLSAWPKPRNLLHLIFSPHGLRPAIANWEEVASGLLQRVQREAVGQVLDDRTADLLEQLKQYPGVTSLTPPSGSRSPVIPLHLRSEHQSVSLFSLVTTVGTPQTIAAEELRIELMFPADDAWPSE